jgi:hypothetical protein
MKIYLKNMSFSILILINLLISNALAGTIYLDELPISITQTEFLKKYPAAVVVLKKTEPVRQMLVAKFPKTIQLTGKFESTTGRTFVGETSCAAASGFGPMSIDDGQKFLKFLIKRHSKVVYEKKVDEGKGALIYMTDADSKIRITLRAEQNEDNKTLTHSVTYSVVLNTCPLVVAKDHQVIAPQ